MENIKFANTQPEQILLSNNIDNEKFNKEIIYTFEYYPILIAHNGISFDFPFLLNEMVRNELSTKTLERLQIRFTDSLTYLKKHVISDSHKLSELYINIMGKKLENAHSALGDVFGLADILFHNSKLESKETQKGLLESSISSTEFFQGQEKKKWCSAIKKKIREYTG